MKPPFSIKKLYYLVLKFLDEKYFKDGKIIRNKEEQEKAKEDLGVIVEFLDYIWKQLQEK